MKRFIFFTNLACVVFLLSSCARSYRDCALYESSGKAKPIVAVLPVIDTASNQTTAWSVSEELTQKIQRRVSDSSKLYLLKDKGNKEIAQVLNALNPNNLPETIGKSLGATEFVIVTELVDQDVKTYMHPNASENKPYLDEVAGNIHVAMRVRVLDVRNSKPKVILQEVVAQDYEVSKPYVIIDYDKYPWGEEAYERTPLGMCHNRIVREIVAHVEGYITANRS